MASITFAVDEELNRKLSKFLWVNLSELVKQELTRERELREQFESFKKIVSKSKFTEKDAEQLSDKIKLSMNKRLKRG